MAGYIGSGASVVSSGVENKKVFDITTNTTSLTGLNYTVGKVHVYHNGVRLVDGTDFTANNSTSITLTVAAVSGDQVVVVSFASFQLSESYTSTEADTKFVTKTGDTMSGDLDITGTLAATAVTGDGSGLTGLPAGGITEADQWRLTTTFTANQYPITSNWERNDTSGYATLGTGMTESSGTFTFPSTGIYRIGFQMTIGTQFAPNYSTQGCWAYILTTTNNSSYANAAMSQQGIYNFSTSYFSGGSIYVESIFDVTNVSTHKARFGFGAGQGGESCRGSSSSQLTGVTFMKLGDT